MSATKQKPITVKSILKKWDKLISERGLKQSWIADKMEISQAHLSNILAGRGVLTANNRRKINEILNTNF